MEGQIWQTYSNAASQTCLSMKLLGQRLMARDFDRQVAELQIRVAVANGHTAFAIPVKETKA